MPTQKSSFHYYNKEKLFDRLIVVFGALFFRRFGRICFLRRGFCFSDAGRQLTNGLIDNGVDDEVAYDLDQEVKADKSGDQKDEKVFVARGVLEDIGKENKRTDNENTRIDERDRYRSDDRTDKVVLFCDQFMKKPG